MKIEEYLKSSPIFVLLHAQQAVQQELQKILLSEQVNFLQALTLITILLEGHRPITPGQLVKTFHCSKARLSQMLSYLEGQAWLNRTVSHADARSHALTLTSQGIAKANRLIKCVDAIEHSIEEKMDAPSLQALTSHLRQLREAFRAPSHDQ